MDRGQILSALKTRMQIITQENGYLTNIGLKVYDWKLTDFGEEDMPGVNLIDGVESYSYENVPNTMKSATLQIDIDAAFESSVEDSKAALKDIEKALGQDETLGGLIQSIRMGSSVPATVQKDHIFSVSNMRIECDYLTDRWRQ